MAEVERLTRVDVHLVDLDAAPPGASEWLDARERARFARVRHPVRARRRAAAAAATRLLLGAVCGADPAAVSFSFGSNGKPRLEPFEGLEFNVSRSERWALVGVARRPLGVDLETVRTRRYRRGVARRFFPTSVAADIEARARHEGDRPFLRTWTRLEAWVKATGEGLRPAAIAAVPAAALQLRAAPTWVDCGLSGAGWWVVELAPASDLVAAIVVADGPPDVHVHREPVW